MTDDRADRQLKNTLGGRKCNAINTLLIQQSNHSALNVDNLSGIHEAGCFKEAL